MTLVKLVCSAEVQASALGSLVERANAPVEVIDGSANTGPSVLAMLP